MELYDRLDLPTRLLYRRHRWLYRLAIYGRELKYFFEDLIRVL